MNRVLILLLMFLPLAATADRVEIDIHGMSCSFCVEGLQDELSQLPDVEQVQVSLKNKKVLIISKEGDLDLDRIKRAIVDSGYTPKEIRHIDPPKG